MKYRAEIDGLRALAVIPVILFHAGFELFSGGFVGVDVFFVISGYLITTILVEDIENGRFSIVNFYERRARRILPALFLVMFVCIPFAWIWMLPSEMKDFSESLIAVSLFVSNILFWLQSGYFEAAAEQKPLLHTWSLAVEEQYYILFPIFLLWAWRYGKTKVFWMIVFFASISLALSEWGWRSSAVANFYLAPMRAWELFAGSIAAFIVHKQGVRSNNILSILGLAAILFSIFVYDESTPFPSVYALVPVIGVVFLILYARQETLVAKVLSNKGFVGIGLISYSAYLWHQPLFAFARLRVADVPSSAVMLALSALSILLAFLSWKFVEQPFRRSKSKIKLFVFSVGGMILFICLGFVGYSANGFGDPDAESKKNYFSIEESLSSNFWVVGDSHGDHLLHGLDKLSSGDVVDLTKNGCIPLRNVDRYDYRSEPRECSDVMNKALDRVMRKDPDAYVLLASMGPIYVEGTPFKGKDPDRVKGLGVELITDSSITDRWKVYEIGLRNTLAELSQLKNAKIVFVIDVPELGIDRGCNYGKKSLQTPFFNLDDSVDELTTNQCFVSREDYDQRSRGYKELVHSVLSEYPSIYLYDPTPSFCSNSKCNGFNGDVEFLYKDVDHLSFSGSNYWALSFSTWLGKNIQ